MLPLLLCFKLEKFCSSERKFAELDQNTSAEERERIRTDFWDWILQSHGIPALNEDEIESAVRGRPFNSCGGLGWLFLVSKFFFSSNLGGQDIFFPPKCSAGYFFFSPHFSAGFFFLKKCRVYIYRMNLHLHCGYCSNSSNMELQSLKML